MLQQSTDHLADASEAQSAHADRPDSGMHKAFNQVQHDGWAVKGGCTRLPYVQRTFQQALYPLQLASIDRKKNTTTQQPQTW